MKHTKEEAIMALKTARDAIVYQGPEDEAAAEYYGELTGTIEDIESGKKSVEEALSYISFDPARYL